MKSRAKRRGCVSRMMGMAMTDKPNPVPPRQPPVLPPNFRDVTAKKVGTVIGIVGAPKPKPK
jgi:hypothetical protein